MSQQTLRSKRFTETRDKVLEILSRKDVMTAITVVPVLLLFFVINLLPIAWAIWAGFFRVPLFSTTWEFVGLRNYTEILFETPVFWESLWRSLLFAGGSVLLQLVLGVALALAVNSKLRFRKLVTSFVLLPYLIPTAIIGFMALWLGNSQWGIINRTLISYGLISRPISWFGDAEIAMLAVILTSSWKFTIFVTIMVLARLQSIPDGYYEAARMAGASTIQRFRDITLPNLKGVIFIVLLLRGVWMFNKFDIIYVLTRGGPVDATTTAPIYAYKLGFVTRRLGKAAAVSTLLFLMLALAAVVYFKVFEPEQEVRVE